MTLTAFLHVAKCPRVVKEFHTNPKCAIQCFKRCFLNQFIPKIKQQFPLNLLLAAVFRSKADGDDNDDD